VALADEIAPSVILEGKVAVPLSLVMSVLFTVGFAWLAIDRLRSFRVTGDTG
jgi:ABC-2 type transport system permease protein